MDTDELRSVQAPLKDAYRERPESALVTLQASGALGEEGVACSVDVGRQLVEAGLHPATGGDGSLACSGDMLLQALVACAGVTLRSVAVNRGLTVSGTVRAEGDLDFRGTLGVDREAGVGFRSIRLVFDLEAELDEAEMDRLIATTERYCVVLQTLTNGVPVEVRGPTTRVSSISISRSSDSISTSTFISISSGTATVNFRPSRSMSRPLPDASSSAISCSRLGRLLAAEGLLVGELGDVHRGFLRRRGNRGVQRNRSEPERGPARVRAARRSRPSPRLPRTCRSPCAGWP